MPTVHSVNNSSLRIFNSTYEQKRKNWLGNMIRPLHWAVAKSLTLLKFLKKNASSKLDISSRKIMLKKTKENKIELIPLFQVTKANLDTGLRGYPIGYCTTSTVDPIKGVHYIRRPVSKLFYWEPERVIYLLFYGREGSEQELLLFKQELKSRATSLYKIAEEKDFDNPRIKIACRLRKIVPSILKENPKISNPYANVDAISGAVLSAAGFTYLPYFTLLFGLSRIVGIAIQILYERCEAREGKGVPIYRPSTRYIDR